MRVEGQASTAALWFKTLEKDPSKELSTLIDAAATGKNDQADSAGPNATFPTSLTGGLPVSSVMYLQAVDMEGLKDVAEGKQSAAADEFLAYMKKSPEERMRDNILKSMGLTEEDLEGMPPEQRKAVEDEIAKRIKERLTPVEGEPNLEQQEAVKMRPSLQGWIDSGMPGRFADWQ